MKSGAEFCEVFSFDTFFGTYHIQANASMIGNWRYEKFQLEMTVGGDLVLMKGIAA